MTSPASVQRALLPTLSDASEATNPFQVYDAVAAALAAASEPEGVLVLDDLRRGDAASFGALHALASALPTSRLLVVGTHRNAEW